MPLFGDLADNDFARKLSDFYTSHIGQGEFKDIRDEAKRDNPQSSLYLSGPLIQRGIQGGGRNRSISGIQVQAEAIGEDVARLGKFLASPKGLLHLATRFGQHKMQPYVGGGANPITIAYNKANRNFNPLTIPLQPAAGLLGIHTSPVFPVPHPSYLLDTTARNISNIAAKAPKVGNRLVNLQQQAMKSFGLSAGIPSPLIPTENGTFGAYFGGPSAIAVYPGGPGSLFGFGTTGLFKSRAGNNVISRVFTYYTPDFPYDTDPSKATLTPSNKHFDPVQQKSISVPDNVSELAVSQPSKDLVQYKTLAYGDLKKDSATGIQDFRQKTNYYELQLPDYSQDNIATRLGLPNYGERRGVDDSLLDQLVRFQIGDLVFRGYIDGAITDGFEYGYSEVSYVGAITPSYVYDKGKRSWSLAFKVPSFTATELRTNTQKINQLIQNCAPSISDARAVGAIQRITLGDFWNDLSTIIDKVDVTIEDETPWDINLGQLDKETVGKELPMHYSIQLSGTFLQQLDRGIVAYNIGD